METEFALKVSDFKLTCLAWEVLVSVTQPHHHGQCTHACGRHMQDRAGVKLTKHLRLSLSIHGGLVLRLHPAPQASEFFSHLFEGPLGVWEPKDDHPVNPSQQASGKLLPLITQT